MNQFFIKYHQSEFQMYLNLKKGLMKVFLFFSILFIASHALGNSTVAGTWALSGAGCRNSDLSASSHVSKTLSEVGFGTISSAILTIESDGGISLLVRKTDKTEQTYTGSYTFSDNTLTADPDDPSMPNIPLLLVSDHLVYVDLGADTATICGDASKKLVGVFGRTTSPSS